MNNYREMNRCKICGEPCGIYEICRACQKDINEGKIQKCSRCGNYYFTGKKCSCLTPNTQPPKQNNTTKENNNINVNIEQEKSTPMKDGCLSGMGGCFGVLLAGIIIIVIIAIAISEGF